MQDSSSFFFATLYIVLMLGGFFLLVYQRRSVVKGNVLLTVKITRGLTIFSALVSIVFGAVALFFAAAGIVVIAKYREFDTIGWLLIISIVLFFGKVAIDTSPWRVKLILTDKGLLYNSEAIKWDRIVQHNWVKTSGDKPARLIVVVKSCGLRIPRGIPPYVGGLMTDPVIIKAIDDIFRTKVKKDIP